MIPIPYALDALNFLSADVRNLFGPFINVFLVTGRHWSQTDVGLVSTGAGLLGILLQTPIGAAIDVTHAKRGVIVLTMTAMTAAAVVIFGAPNFWSMVLANTVLALAGDAFVPAVSALTLGLVTRDALARRFGRNSAFDHAGNIFIAIAAGIVGYAFSQRAVFLMVPVFAALTSAAVLTIPAGAINHGRARDLAADGDARSSPVGYRILFETRPLMMFAACAFFFHFANAPLLPLVGQKLALQFPQEATAMMSFCIVAAQGVMLPLALLVGHRADRWGRKPIFLIAFAALPIRATLYTLSDNAWLIAVQLLDGVGAGIYQALTPLVIADIMRGTGRYNLAQGAVATTQGIGASISALAVGVVVDSFGYTVSFLILGAAAAIAFLIFFGFMSETRNGQAIVRDSELPKIRGAAGETPENDP
jgi:MFS family permease